MSHQPYQPMGLPKEVSHERMVKILEKHCPGGFKAAQSPKEKAQVEKSEKPIEWKRIDKYVMQSSDGKWRVVKVILGGKPDYELYAFTPKGWEPKRFHLESFEAAKACL
jgi:hypothetical protein